MNTIRDISTMASSYALWSHMGIVAQAVKQKMPFRSLGLTVTIALAPDSHHHYVLELSLYSSLEYKARFISFKTSDRHQSNILRLLFWCPDVLFSSRIFFIISMHQTFLLQMAMGKTLKQLILVSSFITHVGRLLIIMPKRITWDSKNSPFPLADNRSC